MQAYANPILQASEGNCVSPGKCEENNSSCDGALCFGGALCLSRRRVTREETENAFNMNEILEEEESPVRPATRAAEAALGPRHRCSPIPLQRFSTPGCIRSVLHAKTQHTGALVRFDKPPPPPPPTPKPAKACCKYHCQESINNRQS